MIDTYFFKDQFWVLYEWHIFLQGSILDPFWMIYFSSRINFGSFMTDIFFFKDQFCIIYNWHIFLEESVLGPLWLTYFSSKINFGSFITDIFFSAEKSNISNFVDSHTLYTPGRNELVVALEKIMQDWNRITDCFKGNSLSANPKKSDKPKW